MTENTLTPILPLLLRTGRVLVARLRFWAIVFVAQLVGAAIFFAGWMIAMRMSLLPLPASAHIWSSSSSHPLIGRGNFPHGVAGAVEMFYVVEWHSHMG